VEKKRSWFFDPGILGNFLSAVMHNILKSLKYGNLCVSEAIYTQSVSVGRCVNQYRRAQNGRINQHINPAINGFIRYDDPENFNHNHCEGINRQGRPEINRDSILASGTGSTKSFNQTVCNHQTINHFETIGHP